MVSFQDIVDGFQNKALLIDCWNKPDEFDIDLLQALKHLGDKWKNRKTNSWTKVLLFKRFLNIIQDSTFMINK